MKSSPRAITLLLTLAFMLSACAGTTAQTSTRLSSAAPTATIAATAVPTIAATAAPTATPAPTAVPTLADDVRVAGVDVSRLLPEAASSKVERELAPLLRPLELEAGPAQTTLDPAAIKLELPLDALLAEAQRQGKGARVALDVRYDEAALRAALATFAKQAAQPAQISVITATGAISRSFALLPAQKLDVDAAVTLVAQNLRAPGSPRRVTLPLIADPQASARPTPAQLQAQIEAMASLWENGVVGVYAYDLKTDRPIATLNKGTVFSGASVMKVPILLNAYIRIPTFNAQQEQWLKKMIEDSDNFSANSLLAASAGGDGASTDDALKGALQMSDMLRALGLEHTYQNMPYESSDYLINLRGIKIKRGPDKEGPKPFTEADPVLRTTPEEMSQMFLWIEACGQGKGMLLEKFGAALTPARCKEMIARLEQNADRSRIVAGLPTGTRVAHKSGWVEDMQCDVALVRSPGGDFLLAVYVYRTIDIRKNYLDDAVAAPAIAKFARLVYTYYNPVPAS